MRPNLAFMHKNRKSEIMNPNNKIARIVGALFLTVMVSWFLGDRLLGSVLDAPDYLVNLAACDLLWSSRSDVLLCIVSNETHSAIYIGLGSRRGCYGDDNPLVWHLVRYSHGFERTISRGMADSERLQSICNQFRVCINGYGLQ
jgi:hypothetical protein